jgi:hypothetical protein
MGKMAIRWHGSLPRRWYRRHAGPGDALALAPATLFQLSSLPVLRETEWLLKISYLCLQMASDPDIVGTFEPFLFARLALFFSNPDLVGTKSFDVGLYPSYYIHSHLILVELSNLLTLVSSPSFVESSRAFSVFVGPCGEVSVRSRKLQVMGGAPGLLACSEQNINCSYKKGLDVKYTNTDPMLPILHQRDPTININQMT